MNKKHSGLAIASLVLGITGVLTSTILVGGILGIIGFVFGVSARKTSKKRGMALAGIILSGISFLLALTWLVNYSDIALNEKTSMSNIETLYENVNGSSALFEYKNSCTDISYNELMNSPEIYKNQRVKFQGEIFQIVENDGCTNMMIDISKNEFTKVWHNTVYVQYTFGPGERRFSVGDVVTFYGEYYGLFEYETIYDDFLTIPVVITRYMEFDY